MNENDNLICCTNNAMGIGNRLKHLISFLRYYNNPKTIRLVWPNTGWVSCKFNDIIRLNVSTNIIEVNDLSGNHVINEGYPTNWRLYVSPNDEVGKIKNDDPFNKGSRRIDFLYNKTPQSMVEIYKPYFTNCFPSDKVKKIMEQVDIDSNCVAVQIRDSYDWAFHGRTCYLKDFINEMKKHPSSTKFFVSVMDEKNLEILIKEFPNQIISIPNKDYSSMYYAVADMFLLSIPNTALCSCGSTFYEVSWWLGGCKAEVKIIGDYKKWDEVKQLKSIRQVISKIKTYIRKRIRHK